MNGQMCWRLLDPKSSFKVLHLRLQPQQPWQPYSELSEFSVPDYPIPGGSSGWATYQALLRAGWQLLPGS